MWEVKRKKWAKKQEERREKWEIRSEGRGVIKEVWYVSGEIWELNIINLIFIPSNFLLLFSFFLLLTPSIVICSLPFFLNSYYLSSITYSSLLSLASSFFLLHSSVFLIPSFLLFLSSLFFLFPSSLFFLFSSLFCFLLSSSVFFFKSVLGSNHIFPRILEFERFPFNKILRDFLFRIYFIGLEL